jgi:solute carrier family 25 phosphate transporter 3
MAKFFFFEKIVQLFYTHVFTEPKESYSKVTQLGVTFGSGYLAGVVCAIVSHPADSLVSLLGKKENKGKGVGQIAREVGILNLSTKGLGTRVLMIGGFTLFSVRSQYMMANVSCIVPGTLTGFQWWIYDSFKSAMGLGTTGGK